MRSMSPGLRISYLTVICLRLAAFHVFQLEPLPAADVVDRGLRRLAKCFGLNPDSLKEEFLDFRLHAKEVHKRLSPSQTANFEAGYFETCTGTHTHTHTLTQARPGAHAPTVSQLRPHLPIHPTLLHVLADVRLARRLTVVLSVVK
jgi:hypothetical protein